MDNFTVRLKEIDLVSMSLQGITPQVPQAIWEIRPGDL